MKAIFGLVSLVLAALVLEDKAREVAGNAQDAYGEAVDHARAATETLSQRVQRQPAVSIVAAAGLGYVLARVIPRRR